MTPTDVIKLIKEKDVKFADLRFTDTRGKEQHVTIPARLVDEELFSDGKMFDGSSIAGWKGINESDMILMPSLLALKAQCMWCMTSNLVLCLLALTYALEGDRARRLTPGLQAHVWFLAPVIGLTVLAVVISPIIVIRQGNTITWDAVALRRLSSTELAPSTALWTGPPNARVTVVAFVDMECPLCHALIPRLYRSAQRGGFRLCLRHFPLREHRESFGRAVAVEEISAQGKGWPFVLETCNRDYESSADFAFRADPYLLGLTQEQKARARARVARDADLARTLDLRKTPAIIVLEAGKSVQVLSASQFQGSFGVDD